MTNRDDISSPTNRDARIAAARRARNAQLLQPSKHDAGAFSSHKTKKSGSNVLSQFLGFLTGLLTYTRKGALLFIDFTKKLFTAVKNRDASALSKRTVLIALAGVAVSILVIYILSSRIDVPLISSNPLIGNNDSDTGGDKPEYRTILPDGTSIDDLGGWRRVSPADRNPVFAYADTVGDDVTIAVSQQPMPDELRGSNNDNLKTFAEENGANQSFNAGNTQVFIGGPAEGPQSVIFEKDNLLVLIRATTPVDEPTWVTYINSLD